MANAQGPNLGLHYFWEDLEDGWGPAMNADLQRVNSLMFCNVQDVTLAAPPAVPLPGQMWLLLNGALTGAWAGRRNSIALWEKGVWTFYTPRAGWRVRNSPTRAYYTFDGLVWDNVETTAAELNEQLQAAVEQINELVEAVGSAADANIAAAAAAQAAAASEQIRQIVAAAGDDVALVRQEVYQLQQETDVARRDVLEAVYEGGEDARNALARVITEEGVRANADVALGFRIDTVTASLGTTNANVTSEAIARTSGDVALGVRIDTVSASLGTTNANVTSEAIARASADAALGTRIDTTNANLGTTNANLTSEQTARASGDTALGLRVDTTAARYNTGPTLNYNGNFENLLDGYSAYYSDPTHQTPWALIQAPLWGLIAQSGPNNGQVNLNMPGVAVTPSKTITFSADFRLVNTPGAPRVYPANATTATCYLQIAYYTNSSMTSFLGYGGTSPFMRGFVDFSDDVATKRNAWKLTETPPAGAGWAVPILVAVNMAEGDWFVGVRLAKVELGSVATPYPDSASIRSSFAQLKTTQVAYAAADVALGSRIDTTNANLGSANVAISGEVTARASADAALGTRIDTTNANLGTTNGNVSSEIVARASADTALGTRIDTVTASLGTTNANLTSEVTARATAVTALGQRIDTTNANLGTTNANVTSESVARANADGALSGRIDTTNATVGGLSASLSITQGAVADVQGKTAAFLQIIAAAGADPAFIQVNATGYGSNIAIAAQTVGVLNTINGRLVPVMYASGGVAYFTGNVQIGGNLLVAGSVDFTQLADFSASRSISASWIGADQTLATGSYTDLHSVVLPSIGKPVDIVAQIDLTSVQGGAIGDLFTAAMQVRVLRNGTPIVTKTVKAKANYAQVIGLIHFTDTPGGGNITYTFQAAHDGASSVVYSATYLGARETRK